MNANISEAPVPVATGKIIRASAQLPVPADTSERAKNALDAVKALAVTTDAQYESASEELKQVKGIWADLEVLRKAAKKPFDDRADEVQAFFFAPQQWLKQAELILKSKLVEYSDEQDRLRQEQQRRDNEAAAAKQRELQAAADEARRKADAEAAEKRKQAEAAAAAGRLAEAAKLGTQADRVEARAEVKAETLTERASMVVASVSTIGAPKVSGIKIPLIWGDYEVTDASLIPREYLMIDDKKVRGVCKALKADTNIPGIRATSKKQVAAGRA